MALLSIRMKQKIGPVGELLGCLSGNKAQEWSVDPVGHDAPRSPRVRYGKSPPA